MRYQGGKFRLAKHIMSIVLAGHRPGQTYVEPFVGGGHTLNLAQGMTRLASDINPYLIALYKALQRGWEPPGNVSADEYYVIKRDKGAYPAELVGFVGILCSFGAIFFGSGYARDAIGVNYAAQGKRALAKQLPLIKDVRFECCEYSDLVIPDNSLIYCDPPYRDTKGYGHISTSPGGSCKAVRFDHDKFEAWCIDKASQGHTVFVSEAQPLEGFDIIFKRTINAQNCGNVHKPRTEYLLKPKGN